MKMTGVIVALLAVSSQTSPPQMSRTTTGVLLDISVTDGKGQPVLDLQPSDFEITEGECARVSYP